MPTQSSSRRTSNDITIAGLPIGGLDRTTPEALRAFKTARDTRTLNLMLLPKNYAFSFNGAGWQQLPTRRRELFDLICGGLEEATAQGRYQDLMDQEPMAVAALLNITAALVEIRLPKDSGTSALSYYKHLLWDKANNEAPAQNRFYAYASTDLITKVVDAVHEGDFRPEPLAGWMHHGASRSYKYSALAR